MELGEGCVSRGNSKLKHLAKNGLGHVSLGHQWGGRERCSWTVGHKGLHTHVKHLGLDPNLQALENRLVSQQYGAQKSVGRTLFWELGRWKRSKC